RERVSDGEAAPERGAAGQRQEALRDRSDAGKGQRRRPSAYREIQSPGEVVPEIVPHRHLRPRQHGRWKEAVARRRVEEELPAAGGQEAPAGIGRSLLRLLAPRRASAGSPSVRAYACVYASASVTLPSPLGSASPSSPEAR